jgi:hypothetical protein
MQIADRVFPVENRELWNSAPNPPSAMLFAIRHPPSAIRHPPSAIRNPQSATTDRMAVYDTLYGITAILFALAIPFVWRRFGAAYGVFMLLSLSLPLSSGVFEGWGGTARCSSRASSGLASSCLPCSTL